MAFSPSNVASAQAAGNSVSVHEGAQLLEIRTTELAFHTLNGEVKLQLLPTPWPDDNLPAPSSSLLSVASSRKLVAAAGPEALYIAHTPKIRDLFQAIEGDQVRSYAPDITIPLPRPCQVAFSSDESVLVASTEHDGSIHAFQLDAQHILQSEPTLTISTGGSRLRALAPNPASDLAQLFAVVTDRGDCCIADLKAGALVLRDGTPELLKNATAVSWSNRGKQLVVGRNDGTAVQIKPDGSLVTTIPRPSSLPDNVHISGISWLENECFFIAYTPTAYDTDQGIPPSDYFIVSRDKAALNYTFDKLPEVVSPFGPERLPSSHQISRLRGWQPHLRDLLIVTATTSSDVGLVTKSSKPLSPEGIVDPAFTVTVIDEDTERPQLPLSSTFQDTSPIGMALDLSSTDKVPGPLKAQPEILESDGPMPNLLILNHEGVLVSWWVIYADSVREKTLYPGILGTPSTAQPEASLPQAPKPFSSTAPKVPGPSSPFASSALSGASPTTSTFGAPSAQSQLPAPSNRFGSSSGTPFGQATPISVANTSWTNTGFGTSSTAGTTASVTNKPAFGAPGFGSTSALGKPSFGTTAFDTTSKPAFGQQSPFGSGSTTSPFASAAAPSSGSGFGAFSKAGGFSSFSAGEASKTSPFAKATGFGGFGTSSSTNSFTTGTTTSAPFGESSQKSFPGVGTSSFKLESSFKGDGSAKDDLPKPDTVGGFGFDTPLDDLLGTSKPAHPNHSTGATVGEKSTIGSAASQLSDSSAQQESAPFEPKLHGRPTTTPPATMSQSKATPAAPVSGLFGNSNADTRTPEAPAAKQGWSFDAMSSTTPKETPASSLFAPSSDGATPALAQHSHSSDTFHAIQETPRIKEEPPSDDEQGNLANIPEAPLPPDPVSKPRYASGDTSASSVNSKTVTDDAPLPPDFLAGPSSFTKGHLQQELPSDNEDELSSDFDDSGEEVTEDLQAAAEGSENSQEDLQTSPESSFKDDDRSFDASPTGGAFTKITSTGEAKPASRPLFGEVVTGLGPAPKFPVPHPQESPRSPSPVRKPFASEVLRMDPSRSVSAPARPRSVIDQRKAEFKESPFSLQAAKSRDEEVARERQRREEVARRRAEEEAKQLVPLQDDEDERLKQELERPVSPKRELDEFLSYQPRPPEDTVRTGIPAQVERLASDINKMVTNLGINTRSLTSFLRYQQPNATNQSWPQVLRSDTPQDALHDEWLLGDIERLHEGYHVLAVDLEDSLVQGFDGKLEECQILLGRDLYELRAKLTALRKTLHSASAGNNIKSAPLSAEQSSVQADLRRASASVQSKLVQIEDSVAILKARIAESKGQESYNGRSSAFGRAPTHKKPTVEAVTKTVSKMMSMAEQKSADIDVLEGQLKKLGLGSMNGSTLSHDSISNGAPAATTPQQNRNSLKRATPGSTSSVYHTPESHFGNSARSNRFRTSQNSGMVTISGDDRERWRLQATRKKEAAAVLKAVLEAKRTKARTTE
ncbi:hypothetical protein B0A52_05683 [Exophiala mesophila]|uniref:Nucleoporin Nup159/Nup146 N-terminal domain-containing protein n=1 Tax=Exophiala mesophila TaxID=212818 RepID=A0A438N294_EXOME|nr:hypothetical protein B0A52_05683 [Exophiala mesophila]